MDNNEQSGPTSELNDDDKVCAFATTLTIWKEGVNIMCLAFIPICHSLKCGRKAFVFCKHVACLISCIKAPH